MCSYITKESILKNYVQRYFKGGSMKHSYMFVLVLAMLGFSMGLAAQNNALMFDGVNDCVAIGNMTSEVSTSFTVECWFNPSSVAVGSGVLATYGRTIFASSTSNEKPIWVSQRGSEIWVCAFSGNTTVIKTTGLGLTAGTWYHIAVSVVRGGSVRLYVNGSQVATGTAGITGATWNTTFTIGDLRPGRQLAFYGLIDEVRVWNVIRSADDIQGNYDRIVDPDSSGLVGYWMLDQSSGTNVEDAAGSYDGTIRNGTALHPDPDPMWVDGNPTLPVELSSFTAILTADFFVRLHWTTQSETGVSGFYIYRASVNNLEAAQVVSSLIFATNTTDTHYYEFTDSELFEPGTYYYWLQVQDMDGGVSFHGPTTVFYDNSASQGIPGIPVRTEFAAVYPKPFNPSTTLCYGVAKAGKVDFFIYNQRGQLIRTIHDGQKAIGNWKLQWDGRDDQGATCTTGIYFIKMQTADSTLIRKAVLQK